MTPLSPILQSERLAAVPGVRHAFFTRKGGVSEGLYESLNLGRGSGDAPEAVEENRRRVAAHFGRPVQNLMTVYQIHSAIAHVADAPWSPSPEGDAVVTRTPGLVCAALAADCAPVLIADPLAGVVAAAHAGWRGALGGIIGATVAAMEAQGARAARMVAAIGPCIAPGSYEVGLEFLERFVAAAPINEVFFLPGARPDKRLFDLPSYVLMRLREAGVHHASWIGRDTCREDEMFFSNRRAVLRGEPDYGRLISAIAWTG